MENYILAVGLALVVGLIGYLIMTYNSLVRYRVETDNAWSQIDVQLKRRTDLIPNLVETVKGVMKFEKETLTQVMEARGRALGAKSQSDRLKAEGEISGFLGRLMAVWENYPELKANRNALELQEELTTTENRISYSRGHYNDIVANLNTMTVQFPTNLVANMFGIKRREFFEMPDAEKSPTKVSF